MTVNSPPTRTPRFAFLGICERGRYQCGVAPMLSHIDILGLRHVVLSHIYPIDLSGFLLAIAIYGINEPGLGHLILKDKDEKEIFKLDMRINEISESLQNTKSQESKSGSIIRIVVHESPSWTVILVPAQNVVLNEPQRITAYLVDSFGETHLGVLAFGLASAPSLTPDRIAAIRSDPRAAKAIRVDLGCRECDSKLRVFAALDRNSPAGHDAIWYQDIEDTFDCMCGKTHTPLSILRTNLHALLGRHDISQRNISISTLYEQRALDDLAQLFSALIDKDPLEEEVQKFISQNPIIFHFLYPQRIFEKPPILSKHQADFAILDSRRTLVFVEIERPSIRLIRKDGATGAEMEHAISQVRDWLFMYEKHRGAILECLDLREEEVTKVRGLVISGRDVGHDKEHLRRFKWQDRGVIDCLTYDDLLGVLASLSREMRRI